MPDDRPDLNATFLQPFVSYTAPTGMSCTLQTETTCDRGSSSCTVPGAATEGR